MHRKTIEAILALDAKATEVCRIDPTHEPELYAGAVELVQASRIRAIDAEVNERVGPVGDVDLTNDPEQYEGALDLVRASRLRAMDGKSHSRRLMAGRILLCVRIT
jgi:hypothetical protein